MIATPIWDQLVRELGDPLPAAPRPRRKRAAS